MNRFPKAMIGLGVTTGIVLVAPPVLHDTHVTTPGSTASRYTGVDQIDNFGSAVSDVSSAVAIGVLGVFHRAPSREMAHTPVTPPPTIYVTVPAQPGVKSTPKAVPKANPPKQSAPIDIAKQQTCVAALPPEIKIGQKIFAGITAENTAPLAPVLSAHYIGGAISMGPRVPTGLRGYDAAHPVGDSIKKLKAAQTIPILMGIDYEGGTVQRYLEKDSFPSEQDMAKQYTPAQAQAIMTKRYQDIKDVGFNAVYAGHRTGSC